MSLLVRLALVYPPACDPTAPYPALPALAGFLRPRGVDVTLVDANLEGFLDLLQGDRLADFGDRIERRAAGLQRRRALDHQGQLELLTLLRARNDARAVPAAIHRALSVLRTPSRFYHPGAYAGAVDTVEASLRMISAAHAPLHLDFLSYRTPFALTSPEEIARDAANDPFDGYITEQLVPRLRQVDVVGLSVCFPGQLLPAYSFALKLKRALPGVHLTAGGPALTQILLRLKGPALRQGLGALDSAVVFEGEHTLLGLCRALERGEPLAAIPNLVLPDPLLGARRIPGPPTVDLQSLPAPDFDGLPLDRYLSPHLLLPYDPTRGCYWGRCAFCHYGLTEAGAARYRERTVDTVVEHLALLSRRHQTRFFYLSQDSVAPRTLVRLADALARTDLDLRWGTDLRPEPYLTAERCRTLRRGGAVACSLGVESAHPRVLRLIDKGITPQAAAQVVRHLAKAGIAAEVMCFTDFPTESYREAVDTLQFLADQAGSIAAFIVGQFDLTHGSAVARDPDRFGLGEIWSVTGDALGTALFFTEKRPSKTRQERSHLEKRLERLAQGWLLRRYPWAGSLSTAHTLFHYDRFGPGVFRDLAGRVRGPAIGARPSSRRSPYPMEKLARAEEREAELWHELVHVRRCVSWHAYQALVARLPVLRPRRGKG
jgi:anaerobic magnesium-protoporphyrin IX monomethyl ester cyclase